MRSRPTLTFAFLLIAMLCTNFLFEAVAQTASSPSTSAAVFRIAGTVVSKNDGHPLAGALVSLANTKARQQAESVVTSADGKFEFVGVPAGKYSLTGAKRGFIISSYDQHYQFSTAIVTGADLDTEHLVLKLDPQALISGRVLDEAGEPVRDATVGFYRDNQFDGTHQIQTLRGSRTNDLGEFEIPDVVPGTYFISATAHPWYAVHPRSDAGRTPDNFDRSLDVAYPIIYYPDATDPDSATPIAVHGGERMELEFHLNPVPALRVTIHVPDTDNHQFAFPQFEQPSIDGAAPLQGTDIRMIRPGSWEISGIPAGKYDVRLTGNNFAARINNVALDSRTQELDASAAEPMCSLTVSISFDDGKPSGQFGVVLRGQNLHFIRGRNFDSKGQAKFEDLVSGKYEVSLIGEGTRFTVGHMLADGASVMGHSITLTAGSSASLSISAIRGTAEIQGVAKRAGKPFAGAMVVLVPRNPEGNRDLFRRDQSDLDGTFAFHNVVPGSYSAVAIEDGWDFDWSQPERISTYTKRGVAIEVTNRPGQNLDLGAPVEVQQK